MDYEEMLQRAVEKIPKQVGTGERFEMPVLETLVQGNQTIIKNFSDACGKIRREPRHVLKYLTKELAVPGSSDGVRATLNGRPPSRVIQSKFENYVREFVLCKECSRPDTKLLKEKRITIMRCEACGARGAVKEL